MKHIEIFNFVLTLLKVNVIIKLIKLYNNYFWDRGEL